MNKERTPLRSVRARRDFYTFALFSGFRTNLDCHYQPAEGDQILFCWQKGNSDCTVALVEIVYKFGRPHFRLFTDSGFRDSSFPRDFSFFGRMMRMTIGA